MERRDLVNLLGDLHRLSPQNRALIEARIAAHSGGKGVLEAIRRVVLEEFYPPRGEPPLRLKVARRAIRDYERATGDRRGVLELLVYFVETGNRFTLQFGDIHEEFYWELLKAFKEVVQRLSGPSGSRWRGEFRPRLEKVVRSAHGIGWGYGDGLEEMLEELGKGR